MFQCIYDILEGHSINVRGENMQFVSGKAVADAIINDVKRKVLMGENTPLFVAILVGDDPASRIYVNLKEKASHRAGIEFRKIELPEDVSQNKLIGYIEACNDDENVSGILVQLPLPKHLDTQTIIDSIDPKKDVDGFHPENVKRFLSGRSCLEPVLPRAIMELILSTHRELDGMRALIVANSDLFGTMMLKQLSKYDIHGTYVLRENLNTQLNELKTAHIVIVVCGRPNLIHKEMIRSDAIVIDGGITKIGEHIVGDVDASGMGKTDILLSPVPGGIGPVTIACLLENVYTASIMEELV